MDNLFAGIWSSPDEKTQSTVKLSRVGRFRWGESGNLPGWQRCRGNQQWQLSRGMGGRLRLESVATLVWNTHDPPNFSGLGFNAVFWQLHLKHCVFAGRRRFNVQ
jgi:hypothetical protein